MNTEFKTEEDLRKALEGGSKKIMWVCPVTGKAFDSAFPEKIEEHKQALIAEKRVVDRAAELARERERLRKLKDEHSVSKIVPSFLKEFCAARTTKDISAALRRAVCRTIFDPVEAKKIFINLTLADAEEVCYTLTHRTYMLPYNVSDEAGESVSEEILLLIIRFLEALGPCGVSTSVTRGRGTSCIEIAAYSQRYYSKKLAWTVAQEELYNKVRKVSEGVVAATKVLEDSGDKSLPSKYQDLTLELNRVRKEIAATKEKIKVAAVGILLRGK